MTAFHHSGNRLIVAAVAAIVCCSGLSAQNLQDDIILRTNRQEAVFAKGETVRVYADVTKVPLKTVEINIYKNGIRDSSYVKGPIVLKEGENILLEEAYDETVWVTVSLNAKDSDELSAGFVVAPEGFTPGFGEPKDLLKFWRNEIRKMRKLDMEATLMSIDLEKDSDIEAFNVELNCVGPRPVRGIMAFPKNAKKGTLPIVVFLHAAGTNPGTQSKLGTVLGYAKEGALVIDINAHGFLNGQPDSYYHDFYENQAKGYSSRVPHSREDYYFKWMFLRAQRALDYLTENPLWDGKHVIVTGTSQGGGQSAFLAGIDKRVTAMAVDVPAMLDQGAYLQGKLAAWPKVASRYPDSRAGEICPYFDPALLLKYSKAEVWCDIGLFDMTCPPSSVFAAMNQVKGKKTIHAIQRGHTYVNKWNRQFVDSFHGERYRFVLEQMKR